MTAIEATEAELMAKAERAFTCGDYAEVRVLAARLSNSHTPEVRAKARSLATRVSFDPLALGVWLVALGFFVLVVLRYVGHGG